MNKFLPRDSARSMHLEEGTGSILMMCPIGDFLEMYKKDTTFRVDLPDGIDPEHINTNAPCVSALTHNVGSNNPIVARVLLQNHELIKAANFQQPIDKKAVILILHKCKEQLLTCDKIAKKIATEVDKVIHDVTTQGLSVDRTSSGFNAFPHLQDLNEECATFLSYAKRAIGTICELPFLFLSLPQQDNNFDHLGKKVVVQLGETAPLYQFIKTNAACIEHIIDLRNSQEHPKDTKKTFIENFKLTPEGNICVPQWYLTNETPTGIKEEMIEIVEYLSEIAEHMAIHLILATVRKNTPYILVRLEESDINMDNPIRYKLSLNLSNVSLP